MQREMDAGAQLGPPFIHPRISEYWRALAQSGGGSFKTYSRDSLTDLPRGLSTAVLDPVDLAVKVNHHGYPGQPPQFLI